MCILVLYTREKLWLVVIAEVKCNDTSLTQSLSKGSGYQGKVGGILTKFSKDHFTVMGGIKRNAASDFCAFKDRNHFVFSGVITIRMCIYLAKYLSPVL